MVQLFYWLSDRLHFEDQDWLAMFAIRKTHSGLKLSKHSQEVIEGAQIAKI